MPIIKDPKMNTHKEADFGVLYDERSEVNDYFLYYKGELTKKNPKRYFTAGTEVTIDGNPEKLKTNYPYTDGKLNETIRSWVNIKDVPANITGPVIKQINSKIKENIDFPDDKEYLSTYQ